MSAGKLTQWRARHVGFIFQMYNLLPVLTAFQNVELPLLLTKLSKAERKQHVDAALEIVGLADRSDHYPRQLSGGQEQRVAIARAIVADPTFLLCDEPTGDLDRKSADEILELLTRLCKEHAKTILMVTHDPLAADRAGAILHLNKGVLVEAQAAGRAGVKYFRLLLVNLFRKKIRTGLTIGSFAIAMLLFGLLVIVRFAFNQGVEVAGADRLIVMNRVTFIEPLPISYMDRIAAIPGVKAVSHATWFGGTYQDPKNFFPQFAVDPETWHAMYPEYVVPDDEFKAFVADRQAAIAGVETAKRFGWKIGDRIPIEGAIYPGHWQFNLVGIYTAPGPRTIRRSSGFSTTT